MVSKLKSLKENQGFMKYFKNTSWLFGEKILRMIVGFFVGIWMARYLGPEQFGLFSYAQSFIAIFSIIATMGIDGILVRELVKNENKRDTLLGTSFFIQVFGAFVVLFLLFFTINFIISNDKETNTLLYILACTSFFNSFSVIDGFFRSQVLSKFIMYSNSIALFVSALVKVSLIVNNASLVYFAYSMLFDSFILACSLIYFYLKRNLSLKGWNFNILKAKELLRDGWPLILSGVVTAIYMNTDRIMLKELLDVNSVGQYAVASKISAVWYFIPIVISSSLFPAIINAKKQSEELYYERLQKLYDLVVWIAIVIAIPITFFSDLLIELLFGKAYIEASGVLVIHIWTGVFIALWVVASKWFTVENYLQNVMVRTIIGAILNIVLNYILIPKFGVIGAAWATLFSYMFINYLSTFLFKKTRICFYQQTKAFNLFRIIKGIRS